MGVKRDYIALLLFCAVLAVLPVWGGRTGNGVSDYMQASMQSGQQIFTPNLSTQAQGSVSFKLNLIAFPTSGGTVGPGCGVHCGEIVNVIGGHNASTGGCSTVTGACLDIFVCPTTTCTGGFVNTIIVDITTPNTGEAETGWGITTGTHLYTFLLNRTASLMQMYKDGVLQTIGAFGQSSDPGPINYSGSGTCSGNPCQFTVLASVNASTSPDNFVNATISDLAFWNVTLNVGEIKSLANCVPPNRIEPEHVSYWPIYGADATEPNYTSQLTGSLPLVTHPFNLTLHGTSKSSQQVGCQPGGAYR